jgi:sn-glycerol 3-phosphate transport system ATP-binding protein
MTMADQVILMKDGRIEQDGAPADLYERPASIFTARFVGTPSMNVLPATALAEAGGASLLDDAPTTAGVRLMLGVRPEAMSLVDEGGVPATVIATEYLGADTLVQAQTGGGEMVARLPGRTALSPGAAIRLGWPGHSRHWFDADTGLRIT